MQASVFIATGLDGFIAREDGAIEWLSGGEVARSYIRATKYALSGTEHMKGLERDATWRKNKLEHLARHIDFDHLADKAHRLMTGGAR